MPGQETLRVFSGSPPCESGLESRSGLPGCALTRGRGRPVPEAGFAAKNVDGGPIFGTIDETARPRSDLCCGLGSTESRIDLQPRSRIRGFGA